MQRLLIPDTTEMHLVPLVLCSCKAAGIWLMVAPPRMTFTLQQLDFIIFALFKAVLAHAFLVAQIANIPWSGDVSLRESLRCVNTAIVTVVDQRPWHAIPRDTQRRAEAPRDRGA